MNTGGLGLYLKISQRSKKQTPRPNTKNAVTAGVTA
jgi:hypothetical protein